MTSTPSSTLSPDSSGTPIERERGGSPLERLVILPLAFLIGAAILCLEILGGRVLQPEFGSGLYVWGSVLSVFMVSLAIGYWLGGRLSARRASLRALMMFPLIGGCIIFLLPYVYGWLMARIFDLVVVTWDSQESYGSLLAATLMFLLPSAVLGCVSPYSVRLLAKDITTAGTTAGNLYATSTVGSTVGALATSFWGVTAFGVETLFHALGAGLVILSIIGSAISLFSGRRRD